MTRGGSHSPIPRSSRASANPFLGLGWLYLHLGRAEEAAQYLAECIALAVAARSPDTVRAANVALAEQDLVNGDPRAALDRVAAFSDESNAATYRAYSLLTVLARAYLVLGDTTRAEEIVRRGLERATAYRERLGAARMLWVHSAIFAREGRCPQAERALNEAAAAARELLYPFVEALALTELGTGYLEREQWRLGRESLTAALAIFQRLQARPYIERIRQALEQFTPAVTEADVQALLTGVQEVVSERGREGEEAGAILVDEHDNLGVDTE